MVEQQYQVLHLLLICVFRWPLTPLAISCQSVFTLPNFFEVGMPLCPDAVQWAPIVAAVVRVHLWTCCLCPWAVICEQHQTLRISMQGNGCSLDARFFPVRSSFHCFMAWLHINKEGSYQGARCVRPLFLEDMSAQGTKCTWVILSPLSPMHVKG